VAVRAIATGRGQSSSCVLPSVGNRASTPRSAGHAEGVGSWVLGFRFWVLGFGFWVLGFGTVGADCTLPVALPGRSVRTRRALAHRPSPLPQLLLQVRGTVRARGVSRRRRGAACRSRSARSGLVRLRRSCRTPRVPLNRGRGGDQGSSKRLPYVMNNSVSWRRSSGQTSHGRAGHRGARRHPRHMTEAPAPHDGAPAPPGWDGRACGVSQPA
jgi:hypothetical protein